ncbi:MAG: hypothetical protein N3D11_00520 [Candidatus Sumerlaeia bacterium]|nr:hypothetical protein [Candidatus Sumerlaeia bacterium]
MSLILKALRKQRREHLAETDPDFLAEVRGEDSALPRVRLVRRRRYLPLAGITLLLAGAGIVAVVVLELNRAGRQERGQAALPPAMIPVTTPTPSATPLAPIRESVRLRTQPLLRTPAPIELPATTLPAVSAATPKATKKKIPPASAKKTAAPKTAAVSETPDRDIREILTLYGVMLTPPPATALINDEMVRVGDVIEGAKVLAIDSADSVRVEYKGRVYVIGIK